MAYFVECDSVEKANIMNTDVYMFVGLRIKADGSHVYVFCKQTPQQYGGD